VLDSSLVEVLAPPLAYASWGRRVLSFAIDYFVISFASAPFLGDGVQRLSDALRNGNAPSTSDITHLMVFMLLSTVTYSTLLHGWRGSTLGKMAARTVVVNDDGSKLTYQVAFVRAVSFAAILFVSFFVVAPVVVDELRPLWQSKRQTWHDQIARTVVVRADAAEPAEET
jgi:uncharacterized RDD family membrane protein YckC